MADDDASRPPSLFEAAPQYASRDGVLRISWYCGASIELPVNWEPYEHCRLAILDTIAELAGCMGKSPPEDAVFCALWGDNGHMDWPGYIEVLGWCPERGDEMLVINYPMAERVSGDILLDGKDARLTHAMLEERWLGLHIRLYPRLRRLFEADLNGEPLPVAQRQGPQLSADELTIAEMVEVLRAYPREKRHVQLVATQARLGDRFTFRLWERARRQAFNQGLIPGRGRPRK